MPGPRSHRTGSDRELAHCGLLTGVPADVTDAPGLRSAVEDAADHLGRVDVLAHIAGVVRYGEVPDFAEEDWASVMDTNLTALYRLSKYVIPHIKRGGGGAIVSAASVQAFSSQPLVAAYSASKGAVVAMTLCVRIG